MAQSGPPVTIDSSDDDNFEDCNEDVPLKKENVAIECGHNSLKVHINCGELVSNTTIYQVSCEDLARNSQKASQENDFYLLRDLSPNTDYYINIDTVIDGLTRGNLQLQGKTLICGPPIAFTIKVKNENKMELSWTKPAERTYSAKITGYYLEVRDYMTRGLKTSLRLPNTKHVLRIDTTESYVFEIWAESNDHRGSFARQEHIQLKHALLKTCDPVEEDDGKMIYQLKMEDALDVEEVDTDVIKVKTIGQRNINNMERKEKVILLVGSTGAGKTTWINAFANFLFKVKLKDTFRFKVTLESEETDQTKSQTQLITVYQLHSIDMAVDYNVTIIDTPGFCDTRGIKRDKEIEAGIGSLFKKQNKFLEHINDIVVVVSANSARLTHTQKYIFDSIFTLFGKDLKDSVTLLTTFCYAKDDNIQNALRKHTISIHNCFHVDNCVILDIKDSEESKRDSWQASMEHFKDYCKHLKRSKSKSISQTQKVLDQREQIRNYLFCMRQHIADGIQKLEQISAEKCFLRSHEESTQYRNNSTTRYAKYETIEETTDKFHMYCSRCHYTCHEDCCCSDEGNNGHQQCLAMEKTSRGVSCMVCPNKCSVENHNRQTFRMQRIVQESKEVVQNVDRIAERYHEYTGKKLTHQELLGHLSDEFKMISNLVKGRMSDIMKTRKALGKIALLSWPKSQVDYINLLIDNEIQRGGEGYECRVDILENIREEAEQLQAIDMDTFDPFRRYREAMDDLIADGVDVRSHKVYLKMPKFLKTFVDRFKKSWKFSWRSKYVFYICFKALW